MSDSFTRRALTVCGSIGFEQAETVVGTLRTVREAFQHAEIGNVKGGGQQVSHLTHKLGQNNLFYMKQEKDKTSPSHFAFHFHDRDQFFWKIITAVDTIEP